MATQEQQLDAKRRRVSRACDTCRRKKVRCDGLQPSCTNCTTFGFQCTFNDSAKKRGPPKGYIEALENRLHRMENLLGGLVQTGERSKVDLDNLREEHDDDSDSLDHIWPANSDTPLIPGHQHDPSIASTSDISTQSPAATEDDFSPFDKDAREKINAISDNLTNLTLEDGGFVRYLGNSSGIDILQKNQLLKNGYLMVPMRLKEHQDWIFEKEIIISQLESAMPMPPRDLAEHLIECFFNYVHPNMPVLHKPTFMRQYRNPDPLKKPSGVLLHAMFAIASRFSNHPEIIGRDPENFGDEYFERAKRLVDLEYELPRQSSIQALLLMVIYRFTSAKSGGRVWVMLGMAIRMAQDLGMHRNSARWHLPPLETEIRKRLWWACYIMDRWVSACMGRPLAIDDIDCDVDYPSAVEQDWTSPDGNSASPNEENSEKLKEESSFALRYFVETIKLAQILGQILERVYSATTRNHGPSQVSSTVVELDTILTKWLLALPPDLKYNHKSDPTKSKLSESMPSLNICVSAANSVTHLAEHLVQDHGIKYCWSFLTYEVFTASLIHLTNSASLDIRLQTQARKNLIKTIRYMKALGQRWFNAAKFSMVLEDLMCAHLNFDEYKLQGRVLEPLIAAKVGEPECSYPIVLRDQSHPSGGTLLFSPKIVSAPNTPSSVTSSPTTSPSISSITNPDHQEIKQEPGTSDPTAFYGANQCLNGSSNVAATMVPTMASPSQGLGNSASHLAQKSKKPRKTTSQRNSLLFQSSSNTGGTVDQPAITFSSLSTPGMFTQGQAFVDYGQMASQQQQSQQPLSVQLQQQSQAHPQPQTPTLQPLQQAQPFSLTPLFSSSHALQERCLQLQQQSLSQVKDAQPEQHFGQLQQQQLQQQQQQQQQQQYFQQQQQFMQQHQLSMQLQEQQQQAQPQPSQLPTQCSNTLTSSQGMAGDLGTSVYANTVQTAAYQSDGASQGQHGLAPESMSGTSTVNTTVAPNIPGAQDYSSLSLFPSQETLPEPNLMAVPNPFFGIPNTIDWDEWNQYIASAGLQKPS
ncbi:hypothetical protein BG011_002675 [Mortierella polycephala]|uniref:Zn(2)-C6 fungal-type domain-containing protein n=1 Tax=Mortierella polycephala TaxID=41804 RepID=A0A9P6U4V0_9FUNG|nr:hypothetical protein BG011_002675 [Mortierella polycephala]